MVIAVRAVILGALLPALALAQDVVVLVNGDRLSGEIDSLSRGDLRFDPDYAEQLFVIAWAQVVEIQGNARYSMVLSDGRRFIGSFRSDPSTPGTLVIAEGAGTTSVSAIDVVSIQAVEGNALARVSADISFGYSFARANTNQQLTLRSSAAYLADAWQLNASFDTLQNLVDEGADTRRTNSTARYTRPLRGQWFAVGSAGFLQNEEQRLDLRSTIAAGIGRFLQRTQKLESAFVLGGGWTNEKYLDDEVLTSNSAEGLLGLLTDVFDVGALDLQTVTLVYASLSDLGRVRVDFDADTKWELFKDVFWSVGYFHNFDSRPGSETSKNDFGVTTTFGWSF